MASDDDSSELLNRESITSGHNAFRPLLDGDESLSGARLGELS